MRNLALFSTCTCALNGRKGLSTVFFAFVTELTVNVNWIQCFSPNFCPMHLVIPVPSLFSVIEDVLACYLEELFVC